MSEPIAPSLYYNTTDLTYENSKPDVKTKPNLNTYEPMQPQSEYENFVVSEKKPIEKDDVQEDKYESLQDRQDHAYELFSKKEEQHNYSFLGDKN